MLNITNEQTTDKKIKLLKGIHEALSNIPTQLQFTGTTKQAILYDPIYSSWTVKSLHGPLVPI